MNDQTGDFTLYEVDKFNNYTSVSRYTVGQVEGVDTPFHTIRFIYSEDGMLLYEINFLNSTSSGGQSYADNFIYEYKGEHKPGLRLESWIWATRN